MKRFEGYPQENHKRIILTNQPQNFKCVENLARFFGIVIFDFKTLIAYVRLLINYNAITNKMCMPNMIESINNIEQAIKNTDFSQIDKALMKNG